MKLSCLLLAVVLCSGFQTLCFAVEKDVGARHASPLPQVETYDQLLSAIRNVRRTSEKRIEQAVEQEKVREAWETGRLIDEHVLQHQKRAEYGAKVLSNLAKDLETSKTELEYMLQFARAYPIAPAPGQLSWAHYRELLSVNDEGERSEVEKKTWQEKWSSKELRREVRKRKAAKNPNADADVGAGLKPAPTVETKPGKIGVYRVAEMEGKKYYDVGFSIYREIRGKASKQANPPEEELYTYKARVTQVVDGDTFHALIDLGSGTILEQRLRLRRLDAPEIESREGKEAQALLKKILDRDHGEILIKTTKGDDQYGRYLVDIWVANVPIEQELLDSGLLTLRQGEG